MSIAPAPSSPASNVRAAAWLFALAVAPVLLVYLFWDTALLFLPDDAYYYFEIARNMAGGYGSTFDRINPTNGYHPLWCVLLVPLARVVTSTTGFVRAALVAQGALVWLGLCLAFLAVTPRPGRRAALVSGAAAILLLWNFYVSKTVINGLESAVTFAATAALLVAFARAADRPEPISVRRAAGLGALAALAVLGRLDSVFLVAAVVIVWVARMRRVRPFAPGPVLAFAAVPALTLLVYVLLNEHWFGIWLPVSGYVKLVVRSTGTTPLAVAAWIATLAVLAGATALAIGGRPALDRGRDAALVTSAVFVALLQSQSLLYRGVLVPEIWYLAPHVLWLFLVVSAAADTPAATRPRARPLGAAAAVLAAAAIVVSWNVRLQRSSFDAYVAARDLAEWMNTHLPDSTIVAGWDVGIIGYYSHARVINLDGLVNSAEYAHALAQGGGPAYLDRWHVAYIAQRFNPGLAGFRKPGYDLDDLRQRLGDVVFVRTARFASMLAAVHSGRRVTRTYEYQVRRYVPR